jgi:hypothetical protein
VSDAEVAARFAQHRILLCYGLLGEVMAGLRPLGVDYMASQRDWLAGLGLDAQVVQLPTAAPVAANARRVAEAVRAAPGRVVLVAHSKGGLEALAALLRPDVAARCDGFIALQSPFYGSPVADALLAPQPLRHALGRAARLTRLGSGRGLADLTTATRHAWMQHHAAEIAALVARLPVASLATRLEAPADWRDGLYLALARWMEAEGDGPSDGLVPVASALLPGARHDVLTGGHRALVASGPKRDPVGVLRAALLALPTPSPPRPAPAPHPRSP